MPAHCHVDLKIIPGASRDEAVGWMEETLKIKLRAPALEGRANDALVEFLAERLGLPRRAITLVRGARSRHKIVGIDGLDRDGVRRRLGV